MRLYKIVLYKATNLINNKIYIGITSKGLRKRSKVHRDAAGQGRGAVIGAAIRKYGKENIKFETLVVCPDWEYAKEMERRAIATFKPEYNLTKGGDGVLGYRHTPETILKLSATHAGKQYFLGKNHSENTRARMAVARQKYWDEKPHSRKQYIRKNAPKRGRLVIRNGVIYESVIHAAKANGLTRDQLKAALERKSNPGFINGLQFCYGDAGD